MKNDEEVNGRTKGIVPGSSPDDIYVLVGTKINITIWYWKRLIMECGAPLPESIIIGKQLDVPGVSPS